MGNPTYFVDDVAVAARKAEANQSIPDASWLTGMNAGASCANGIGVNEGEGAVIGTAEQFTLLDQAGAARAPQDSQLIGGVAEPLDVGTNATNGDGTPTRTGGATLASLAAGWTAV
tara:strand:+ start:1161 stop:1508 length:348 start_codon:yes stop_codon:yes gene_type:complete